MDLFLETILLQMLLLKFIIDSIITPDDIFHNIIAV